MPSGFFSFMKTNLLESFTPYFCEVVEQLTMFPLLVNSDLGLATEAALGVSAEANLLRLGGHSIGQGANLDTET